MLSTARGYQTKIVHKNPCDVDIKSACRGCQGTLSTVHRFMSYRVNRVGDNAENNTAVASAGSKNNFLT